MTENRGETKLLQANEDAIQTPPAQVRVSELSTWTGRVVDLDAEMFTVDLTPDPGTGGVRVLADFATRLIDGGSQSLAVGDVVYVTSRMVRSAHGLPSETSSIRLRRLGNWSAGEVKEIRRKAESLADALAELID